MAFLLACLTVLARCCLLLHNYTPEKILQPDSSGYERPAQSFLETGRFVESSEIQEFFAMLYGSAPSTLPRPMFIRTPGYPLFIAGAYSLGADRRALIIVQIVLSGLAVWLTYVLGKILFSAWAGVLAALLIALDPATEWCAQVILSESLLSLFVTAAVIVAVTLFRRATSLKAISLGTLLGIAILVKPVAYYLPIPIFAVLLWGHVSKRYLAAALAPLILLVGGWQVRNLETIRTAMFSGVQSLDLLLWRAAGIVEQQQGIDFESAQKQVIHLIPNPEQLSPAELNRECFRAGLDVIGAHPVLLLKDTVKGLGVVLMSPGARSLPQYFGAPAIPFIAGYLLFLLLIYSASLAQAIAMWGQGKAVMPVLAAAVAVYFIALQAGADSGFRYRVAAMPFFAIYAAAGLLRIGSRRRN